MQPEGRKLCRFACFLLRCSVFRLQIFSGGGPVMLRDGLLSLSSFISIHCCLTSGKDVISEAANQSGPRRTGSRGNPVRAGRTGPASFRPDAAQRETRREQGLVFHCWPAAQEHPGIFMRPNCVQMLIFKQEYQVRRCSCQELNQTL